MMKVLLLTTHLNRGGIGIYTVNLAKYLKQRSVDVTVASSGGDLECILADNGIPFEKLDIMTKSEVSFKVWKNLPVLVRLIRSGKFDIIHAQTRVAQVMAYISGKITKIPVVSTCHGFFKFRRFSRKLFPCWGERTIAISKSVRSHLLEDFRLNSSNVVLIYNGIELQRYLEVGKPDEELARELGIEPGDRVIGTIGRLSSVKGYKYLIRAFKDTVSRYDNIHLLLVGEGPEEKALRDEVQQLGLQDNVIITPGGKPLERYLSVMDVFCLPSIHEGLGLSLMEAMASGRACIASKVGGLVELIDHEKNGILVPPEDASALGSAIARIIDDIPLKQHLAACAKNKAADSFSIEDTVTGTIEVYEDVLVNWLTG